MEGDSLKKNTTHVLVGRPTVEMNNIGPTSIPEMCILHIMSMVSLQLMRNIFQACHNVYKLESEPAITDNYALRTMKFNPRLFEVKLSQRMVNVTYIEDADFFVVTEGETARWVNFRSG